MTKKFNRKGYIREKVEDESGAVAILVAFMMVILMVFAAFALDLGLVHIKESKLQTACDSAAMAAAQYLPNESLAKQKAKYYMHENGFDITDCDVKISDDKSTIEITKKIDIQTNFAKVLNVNKLSTKKSATASAGGSSDGFKLDYALFSGSDTQSLPINGAVHVTGGDVHTNMGVEYSRTHRGADFDTEKNFSCANDDYEVNSGVGSMKAGNIKSGIGHVPMPDYHDSIMSQMPVNPINSYLKEVGFNKPTKNKSKPNFSGELTDAYSVDNLNKTVIQAGETYAVKSGYTSKSLTVKGNLIIYGGADFSGNIVVDGGTITVADTLTFSGQITIRNNGKISAIDGINFGYADRYGVAFVDGYVVSKGDIAFNYKCVSQNVYKASVIYSIARNVQFNGCSTFPGDTHVFYGLIYVPVGEYLLQNDYSIKIVLGGIVANQINTAKGSLTINSDNAAANWDMPSGGHTGDGGGSGKVKLTK